MLFGVWHGLLFAVLLFVRAYIQGRLSDFLFGALLCCSVLTVVPYMLGFMGIPILWRELLFFPADPGLLVGPIIYFYLVSQTNAQFYFRRRDAWHLLPFGLYFCYHLLVFAQGTKFVQYWIAEVDLPYLNTPFQVLTLFSNYLYLYATLRHFRRYRRWIDAEYADTDRIKLTWYLLFLYCIFFIITLSWIFNLLDVLGWNLTYAQNWWQYFGVSIITFFLSTYSYTQIQYIYLRFEPDLVADEPNRTLQLSEQETARWVSQINHLMEKESLYLQQELSLSDLAKKLKTNNQVISHVINTGLKKNFNQFVNEYRFAAFQEKLKDPKNRQLTLLAIAFDCGFNSKATFNRVCKKITGLTPRDLLDAPSSPK